MYWISPYCSSGMHSSCCAPSELNPCHFVFPSLTGRMWVTIYRACPIALWVYQRGAWCKKCAGTVGTWPGNAGGSALSGDQIQLRREGRKKREREREAGNQDPHQRGFYMCWRTVMTERCLGSAVFETGWRRQWNRRHISCTSCIHCQLVCSICIVFLFQGAQQTHVSHTCVFLKIWDNEDVRRGGKTSPRKRFTLSSLRN